MEDTPEAYEESFQSIPEPENKSLTDFFTEAIRNMMEKLHVSNRLARILHHRPLIYTFCATLLGITFLPLVIFLLVVCGSFGFGLFVFAVLEGGIIATATIALFISLVIPLLTTIFFTITSYIAYKSMRTFPGFVWRFLGAPVLIFRSLKRKINEEVGQPPGQNDDGHTNDKVDGDPGAPREKQDRIDFGTTSSFRIKIVPVRGRRTWRFSEEFVNTNQRWSGVEFMGDESEELDIAEGVLLYMANFLRTLMSLLMVIFLWHVISSKIHDNCY